MILDSKQVGEILRGRRTQTRRPVDMSEPRYRDRRTRRGRAKRGLSRSLRLPYQPRVGERIAVKTRASSPPSCHVVVTSFDTQRHGDITFPQVLASGYRTTADYKAAWVRQHDRAWLRAQEEMGEEHGDAPLAADDLVDRFDRAHADKTVWVLYHELDRRQAPRLLAASPGSAQADYVESQAQAMPGELEAVDAATLELFAKQNAKKPKVTQLEVWRESRADIDRAIAKLKAAEPGRDVISTIRALERQLERLDQKIDRAA